MGVPYKLLSIPGIVAAQYTRWSRQWKMLPEVTRRHLLATSMHHRSNITQPSTNTPLQSTARRRTTRLRFALHLNVVIVVRLVVVARWRHWADRSRRRLARDSGEVQQSVCAFLDLQFLVRVFDRNAPLLERSRSRRFGELSLARRRSVRHLHAQSPVIAATCERNLEIPICKPTIFMEQFAGCKRTHFQHLNMSNVTVNRLKKNFIWTP